MKFKEKIRDVILFKDLNEKYVTLKEYLDAEGISDSGEKTEAVTEDGEKVEAEVVTDEKKEDADSEKKEPEKKKVYYVTDLKQQSQYVKMFKDAGLNAFILTHSIDQPFISQLEQDNDKISFLRVDSDVTDVMKEEISKDEEKQIGKEKEKLEKLFRKAVNNDKLEVKVEKLKNSKVSAVATLSEENRRMSDMMKMYGMGSMDDDMYSGQVSLTLNANNSLVKYIFENVKEEKAELMAAHIYDLAMLSHRPLAPEAMTKFIERSNEIMEKLC